MAVRAFGAGMESLSNSVAAQRLQGQLASRQSCAKASDRTVAVAMPSHAGAVPLRVRLVHLPIVVSETTETI